MVEPGAPQPARPVAISPDPSAANDRRAPLLAAAVAGAMIFFYWAGASLGFRAGAFAWPFWPANGVVFAVLMRRPGREWALVFLAQVAGELAGGVLVRIPLHWATVAYALADGGESLLAAWLLRRWTGPRFDLRSMRRVGLLLGACLVAVVLAAGLAAAVAMLRGSQRGLRFFGHYAVGDLLGFVVCAPAVLRGLEPWGTRLPRGRRMAEALGLAALLVAVTLVGFLIAWPAGSYALVHAVIPVLAWCALRLGTAGASFGILIVATVGTVLTPLGFGPFATLAPAASDAFAAMQVFLAFVAAPALLFAAAVAERRAAAAALAQAARVEAAGTVASAVAHDFRNLLTVIQGGAQAASDALAKEHAAQEYLAEIQQAADGGRRLTRKLLALGHAGEEREEVVDLCALARDLERMARHVAGPAVRFSVRAAAEPLPVVADRVELERVIFNLVSNAAGASRPGGAVTLDVAGCSLEPSGARKLAVPGVLLRVRDEGSGMDAATLERIFEPFFTTKKPGLGTGLGLTAARALVERARGKIQVASRPGEGTTVSISLPRADPGRLGAGR